ncbi:hypothetical protein HMPREF3150_05331 [Pseudomonas aeruginosa]|nr:hypothetical protein HMPREF3150_05331 [Pseudomonas aeruginosa]
MRKTFMQPSRKTPIKGQDPHHPDMPYHGVVYRGRIMRHVSR